MATRNPGSRARASTPDATSEAAKALSESAQKIWLAGLGALERAREEGPRVFDTLVEQGKNLGGQARETADQALRALRGLVSGSGETASREATRTRKRATGAARATVRKAKRGASKAKRSVAQRTRRRTGSRKSR
jgi:poly(hydroxyalkanoate) granule-associated protein